MKDGLGGWIERDAEVTGTPAEPGALPGNGDRAAGGRIDEAHVGVAAAFAPPVGRCSVTMPGGTYPSRC